MRLPVVAQLSTKDGTSNKNARLTNCLKESKKSGEMAVMRPGIRRLASISGDGNGLVAFNDQLLSIYGATLRQSVVEVEATQTEATTTPAVSVLNTWEAASLNGITCQISGSLAGANFLTSYDLINWVPVYPPSSYGVSIAAGNALFCIMGDADKSMISYDGLNWTLSAAFGGDPDQLMSFANGYFFCPPLNQSSILYRSTDGLVWSAVTTPFYSRTFAGGDGLFCCAEYSGTLLAVSKNNGDSWATVTNPMASTRKLVFYRGTFILCSTDGTAGYYTSSDCLIWQHKTDLPTNVSGYDFVAGNHILTAYDGDFYYFRESFDRPWASLANTLAGASNAISAVSDGVYDWVLRGIPIFGTAKVQLVKCISLEPTRSVSTLTDSFFDFAQSTL